MRVKMILPALTEAKSPFWHPIKYSLFPPLGLATLAGYLDAGDEVPMQDEHVERLDLEDTPDLVVIQVYITSAYRAYRIADHYRRRGAHVALRRLSARLSRSGLPITNANAGVDAADPARSEGFETLDRANLMEQRKYQNLRRDYAAAIHRLHGLGVMIYGSFVFGMNADDSSVFARTVQWAIEFHGVHQSRHLDSGKIPPCASFAAYGWRVPSELAAPCWPAPSLSALACGRSRLPHLTRLRRAR
jgi:hypothetical protein